MRWLIVLLILFCKQTASWAQFQFDFTQGYTVPFALNPALSGIEYCVDIKVATRMRLGDTEFAPRTDMAGISIDLSSLRYADGIRESKSTTARQGVSLFVLQDKFGPYSSANAAIGYAYHLPLSNKVFLSAGFAADFSSARVNMSALIPNDVNDAVYLELLTGASSRTVADLTIGGTLYADRFYIGYSAFRVVRKAFNDANWSGPDTPFQSAQAGFNFPLSLDLQFYGSGVAQFHASDAIWNAAAKVRFRDFLWLGGAYHSKGAASGIAGFAIRNIQINYSYNLNYIKYSGWNTHELSIGISLFRKDTDKIYPFIL